MPIMTVARFDAEHRYLRQAAALLEAFLDVDVPPAPEAPMWRMLESAAAYLRQDFAWEMAEEERDLYGQLGDGPALSRLRAEHGELALAGRALAARIASCRQRPDAGHWAALRHMAAAFSRNLIDHLEGEEALVRTDSRAEVHT